MKRRTNCGLIEIVLSGRSHVAWKGAKCIGRGPIHKTLNSISYSVDYGSIVIRIHSTCVYYFLDSIESRFVCKMIKRNKLETKLEYHFQFNKDTFQFEERVF